MDFETKAFKNVDNEDFIGKWDAKEIIIKAGETRHFPEFLCSHLAKHLIMKIKNRELDEALEKDPTLSEVAQSRILNGGVEDLKREILNERPLPPEPPVATKEEVKPKFVCSHCGFEAKSEFGLKTHLRSCKKVKV